MTITNTLLNLPENDDSMDCECDNGIDRDGYECTYCEGIGTISEREYQQIKRAEQDDYNSNLNE
ncbi:hypothetical protein LCGC14_1851350 [marine sediment metagenome]|uniref:Uncharacterized protein n=1 Tax=marine sediment metagenome TaxID=412755 RepID=A0A0F9GA95_9ZZZZ